MKRFVEFLKRFFSGPVVAGAAALVVLVLMPALAFASEIIPPSKDEVMDLIASFGGIRGASAVAISFIIVQCAMIFIRFQFGEMLGKYRLAALYFLTLAAGILSLHLAGVSWPAALIHSNTLAALQVFMNQVFKQFVMKED